MTDGELLGRFIDRRDEAAFEGLVRRHGAMVLGLCRRALGDENEAEDAFQSTFLVLVRNARSIRKRDSLASWLYGVALRVARKAQVGGRRRELVLAGEDIVDTGPEMDPERREFRPIVHDEVERLPEKYRAPVVLCYFEGRSHEEAARELDWPVGTVKGRLSRARDLLQSRLVRRGVLPAIGLVAFLGEEASAAVPESLIESTVLLAARSALAESVAEPSPPDSTAASETPAGRRRLLIVLALMAAFLALLGRGVVLRAGHAGPGQSAFALPWPIGPGGPAGAGCHGGR